MYFSVCTQYGSGPKNNIKPYLSMMDFFKNKKNESWMKVINNYYSFTKKIEDNEEEDDENNINEI